MIGLDMYGLWEKHCKARGGKAHRPLTEGGTATYDSSFGGGRIYCAVEGCHWQAEDKARLAQIAAADITT